MNGGSYLSPFSGSARTLAQILSFQFAPEEKILRLLIDDRIVQDHVTSPLNNDGIKNPSNQASDYNCSSVSNHTMRYEVQSEIRPRDHLFQAGDMDPGGEITAAVVVYPWRSQMDSCHLLRTPSTAAQYGRSHPNTQFPCNYTEGM